MPIKLITLISLLALTSACSSLPVGNAHVPEPAKAVQLDRYVGVWYEIARYENGFEEGCEGVTAKYEPMENARIKVINTCHENTVTGPKKVAIGKAKVAEQSRNAKLKVSFFGPFYFGDYWVLDRAMDYSWSIVGEPSGRYLWILARNPHPSKKQKAMLYKKAHALGYDTRLLRETAQ